MSSFDVAELSAFILLGMLFAFFAGFTFAFVILRTPDDPLSVERMSQPTPPPEKRFFPGDPEEPVYEGPAWDLPGLKVGDTVRVKLPQRFQEDGNR